MTDRRRFRNGAAALALIPAAAGVFGASLAWSDANDPLAAADAATSISAPSPPAIARPPAADRHLTELAAQVRSAQTRIAALQGLLVDRAARAEADLIAAQSAAAGSATARTAPAPARPNAPVPAGAAGSAPAAPAPAPVTAPAPAVPPAAAPPAPAPAPAPAVQATTGASG